MDLACSCFKQSKEKRWRSKNISTKRAVSTATRSTVFQKDTVATPLSVHEDVNERLGCVFQCFRKEKVSH